VSRHDLLIEWNFLLRTGRRDSARRLVDVMKNADPTDLPREANLRSS